MIESSESEWSFPTILVPKPNGEVRCCVDLRKVNRLVIDESFPIPRIDDMVERIGKARFLTKLDLSKGFHQIPSDEASKPINSVSTPFGQYQWRRLPFGLNTSPACFSSRIAKVLIGLESFCSIYIDDVIFGNSW